MGVDVELLHFLYKGWANQSDLDDNDGEAVFESGRAQGMPI